MVIDLRPAAVGTLGLTDYHASYLAHELTRRHAGDGVEKLAGALIDAQVDLNPHQIDAALFAFRSPLAAGALLADEVGLGKTIETGLVIAQLWAERKRTILVVTPANLRKQWLQELTEKFFLPCTILESKAYNEAVKAGNLRPFATDAVVICSYQFAKAKAADVRAMPWDLVVMDEAHRLRNVYKPGNVIAHTLKEALADKRKLLLTATPLQNSLLELYGLVGFIDEYTFGDQAAFKERYANARNSAAFAELRDRLKPVCHRTLRRQVLPYVRYTKRWPLLQPFTPEESEDTLYDLVSEYLQRENLQALPAGQRSLMTLVLRKLLASSTFAIAGALQTLTRRLERKLAGATPPPGIERTFAADFEGLEETAEEWDVPADPDPAAPLSEAERAALAREIAELKDFTDLALSVEENAKGAALLVALERAFAEAARLGAPRKAVVFTESRKTQDYLLRVLAGTPFGEGIVLFNGSNADPGSKRIYDDWLRRHAGTDKVTGSRTADMRSALVDEFRERGQILIATEAGAEGINLQFCSLVVNYDLPWNPQRIEQRIGRCHRYGQKHDVVVVNFLNQSNAADQRVFELLAEKFHLFSGVFGASDEVLGAVESGVDVEKRIAAIYQGCRLPGEIEAAFDALQRELEREIGQELTRTRQQLLENFDDEVREKLKVRDETSRASLGAAEAMLMRLTRHELAGIARFEGDAAFELLDRPATYPATAAAAIPLGRYELPRRSGAAHLYRLGHPLAQAVIDAAKTRLLPPAEVVFDYGAYEGKISALEPFVGGRGWLALSLLAVAGPDLAEDHLVAVAVVADGRVVDEDVTKRFFSLPAVVRPLSAGAPPDAILEAATGRRSMEILGAAAERNAAWFDQELGKLDAWADDRRLSLRKAVRDLDAEIADLRKQARQAGALPEKLALQRKVNALEGRRDDAEAEFRAASREVEARKNGLLDEVEARLKQDATTTRLFTVAWRLE